MSTHPLHAEMHLLTTYSVEKPHTNARIKKAVNTCINYVVNRRESCKFPLNKIPDDIHIVIKSIDKYLNEYDRKLIEDLYSI